MIRYAVDSLYLLAKPDGDCTCRDYIGLVPGRHRLNVGQTARTVLRENALSGRKGAARFCPKSQFACRTGREANTAGFGAFRILYTPWWLCLYTQKTKAHQSCAADISVCRRISSRTTESTYFEFLSNVIQ